MSQHKPAPESPSHPARDPAPGGDAGEDEGSAAKEGNEDHLKEDQKTSR
jgi:hypothetical protein